MKLVHTSPMTNLPHANIPVVNKANILKRAQEIRQKAAQDYQKKFSNAKNYSDISGPTGSSGSQHAQNVIKTSKKQLLIQKAYNIERQPRKEMMTIIKQKKR